ncbi:MAG: hypothetical protein LUC43_04005 [Burkholderiales bacterium]|nr:hypothetical protein [Burkholderiales bacterium]
MKQKKASKEVVGPNNEPVSHDWVQHEIFNRVSGVIKPQKRKIVGTTRYERLSLMVVIASWGLLTAIILGIHFYNYDKETVTSSKSPTHSSFYGVVGQENAPVKH